MIEESEDPPDLAGDVQKAIRDSMSDAVVEEPSVEEPSVKEPSVEEILKKRNEDLTKACRMDGYFDSYDYKAVNLLPK